MLPVDAVSGFLGYFSILSMVSWMTTMCWDLCWTFVRKHSLIMSCFIILRIREEEESK
jgi:hypothetical protein